MAKKTVQIDGKPVAVGTAAAFDKLAAAFEKKFGLTLHVRSGLRTRAEQQRLYDLYLAGKGNLAAKPGTSRHESGRAIDVYDSGSDPGVTKAGNKRSNWLKANAGKYGFTANGYTFSRQVEPWHIEYTGDPWKAPKPDPRKGLRVWFGLQFLNVKAGDDAGKKTFATRAPKIAAQVAKTGTPFFAGVELPAEYRHHLDVAMKAHGYSPSIYGRSAFIYTKARPRLIASGIDVFDAQYKGRHECALHAAYGIDGLRTVITVTHLDVYGTDGLRIRQVIEAVRGNLRLARKHKIAGAHRVLVLDHNTPSGAVHAVLVSRGWKRAVGSKRCAIYVRRRMPVWSAWQRKAPSDHPRLIARLARKK